MSSTLAEQLDLRLAVTDLVVGDACVKVQCREHNDKTASLAVYPKNIHCFGCGFNIPSTRTIEALAYLLRTDEREAVAVASKYTNEALDRYREKAAQEARMDPLPKSLATIYNNVLNSPEREDRLDWFYARGLTLDAINDPDVLLGHDGLRFVIPVFDKDRNLVSLRYRLDPAYNSEEDIAKHKYLGMKGRNGLYLYPENVLHGPGREQVGDSRTLVICEGELDALRLWQAQMPAVSVTNGAGQVEKLPGIIYKQLSFVRTLVIATDQDEAGEEAAMRTRNAAENLNFKVQRLRWKEGKDVTEALQLGQQFSVE